MPRRVVLVVGAPGAGKSTLAEQLARDEGLRHLESEMFPGGGFVEEATKLAGDQDARAVVVRCCATRDEQDHWETMIGATETVVLDVDPSECARRVAARRRPGWRRELLAAKAWRERRADGMTSTMTARDW